MTTSTKLNCGPLTISSDFDSGNILKAELVYPGGQREQVRPPNKVTALPVAFQFENQDYEINLWTQPDCYGTLWQNGNRTWFHFGINGGKSNAVVKINIININKQTKLFLQGMQPVCKVMPDRPRWERIEDRVIVNENKPTENGCNITFRIKLPENTYKSTLFIAFTYPFGYMELCDLLQDLDGEFLNKQFSKVSSGGGPKVKLNRRELWLGSSSENHDIYYHRECVCYSLEGRRVDLLTISSTHGISENREDRLSNLFPILEEPRPFKFPTKKVVFLSARVHPGETPSSFVLNGFLRFIMHKTDPRAVILRRLFVFKFIPILNPDGVYKGHYRTDPRGVNLNRVYLNPSAKLHPSIYAARKLLIYYHCGIDTLDENEESEENVQQRDRDNTNTSCSIDNSSDCCDSPSVIATCSRSGGSNVPTTFSEDACFDPLPGPGNQGVLNPHHTIECNTSTAMASGSKKPYTFVLSDANSLCAGCVPSLDDTAAGASSGSAVTTTLRPRDSSSSLNESTHQCAFEACDEDSVYYENLKLNDPLMEIDQHVEPDTLPTSGSGSQHSSPTRRNKKGSAKGKDNKKPRSNSLSEPSANKDNKRLSLGSGVGRSSSSSGIFSGMKWPFTRSGSVTRSQNKSGTMSTRNISTSRYYDSSSGLFLYVDMHGHTTKRGIFMYGNHFPDVSTQAECMLVPRVMALNNPHFDFAGCNFTERLMCCKDKKDGMSREGSGRVACYKFTGLVRSYTLECNYNTGRIVNPIVSRSSNAAGGFFDDTVSAVFQPPKYTIELFEQIGSSLAETVLDMSGQNPYSRLTSTEFKTIEGVKRSLVNRLKLSPEFRSTTTTSNLSSTGPESPLKLGISLNNPLLDANGNPVLPSSKSKKSTVLTPSQKKGGGPLGLKNRENNNRGSFSSMENAKPPLPSSSSSGSQVKKLPKTKKQSSSLSNLQDAPVASSSSSASMTKSSSSLPKSKLSKIMKMKSFPRVSSAKGKGKTKKSSSSNFDTLSK